MTDIAPATVAAPVAERLETFCIAFTRPVAFIGVLGMLIVASATVIDVLMRWLASTAITRSTKSPHWFSRLRLRPAFRPGLPAE